MDYENILAALRDGNVPKDGAKNICMGREKEVEAFEELLEKIDKNEIARVKFVNGEFGAGILFL